MAKRTKSDKKLEELEFDFIKSNFFRVIKADGAFGGLTGNGSLHMALYSERNAIPTKTVHKVMAGGLGPEIREKREGRKAVVREVEIDVTMDIGVAIVLRNWLDEKITQFQKLIGPIPTDGSLAGSQPSGNGIKK
jgi:hypothetical protein